MANEYDFSNVSNEELEKLAAMAPDEQEPATEDENEFANMSDEELENLAAMAPAEYEGRRREDYGIADRLKDQWAAETGRDYSDGWNFLAGVANKVAPLAGGVAKRRAIGEDKAGKIFVDDDLWSAFKKEFGTDADESMRGHKEREIGAGEIFMDEAAHNLASVATDLPLVGTGVKALRDKVRKWWNGGSAAKQLVDIAQDAGIDSEAVERAVTYSQGDPEKMREYFQQEFLLKKGYEADLAGQSQANMRANPEGAWSKVLTGLVNNVGYTAEYALGGAAGGAGKIIIPALLSAATRYQELTNDEYARAVDGRLIKMSGADGEGLAAGKAVAGGLAEAAVETLTDTAVEAILARVPFAGAIGKAVKKGLTKSAAGRALVDVADYFNALGQVTGVNGIGTELLEEDIQSFVDDVLGLGKKRDEWSGVQKEWDDYRNTVLTAEGQLDTFYGLLGTMALQGGAALAKHQYEIANKGRLDDDTLRTMGVSDETIKRMTKRDKAFWYGLLTAKRVEGVKIGEEGDEHEVGFVGKDGEFTPKKQVKYGFALTAEGIENLLKNTEAKLGQATANLYGKVADEIVRADNSGKWGGKAYEDTMSEFEPPKNEDGSLQWFDAPWDKTGTMAKTLADEKSGITIRLAMPAGAEGEGVYFVEDANGNACVATSEMGAIAAADQLSRYGQTLRQQRGAKAQYIQNRHNEIAPGTNATIYNTMADLMAAHPELAGQDGFRPDNQSVQFGDGSVAYVLDNIGSVQEANAKIIHEAVVHSGLTKLVGRDSQARFDFLHNIDPKLMDDMLGTFAKQAGVSKDELLTDPRYETALEEAFAHTFEGALRSPTRAQLFIGKVRNGLRRLGVELPQNESDVVAMLRDLGLGVKQGQGEVKMGAEAPRTVVRPTAPAGEAQEAPENAPAGAPAVDEGASVPEAPQAQEAAPKAPSAKETPKAPQVKAKLTKEERKKRLDEGRAALSEDAFAAEDPRGEIAAVFKNGILRVPKGYAQYRKAHNAWKRAFKSGGEFAGQDGFKRPAMKENEPKPGNYGVTDEAVDFIDRYLDGDTGAKFRELFGSNPKIGSNDEFWKGNHGDMVEVLLDKAYAEGGVDAVVETILDARQAYQNWKTEQKERKREANAAQAEAAKAGATKAKEKAKMERDAEEAHEELNKIGELDFAEMAAWDEAARQAYYRAAGLIRQQGNAQYVSAFAPEALEALEDFDTVEFDHTGEEYNFGGYDREGDTLEVWRDVDGTKHTYRITFTKDGLLDRMEEFEPATENKEAENEVEQRRTDGADGDRAGDAGSEEAGERESAAGERAEEVGEAKDETGNGADEAPQAPEPAETAGAGEVARGETREAAQDEGGKEEAGGVKDEAPEPQEESKAAEEEEEAPQGEMVDLSDLSPDKPNSFTKLGIIYARNFNDGELAAEVSFAPYAKDKTLPLPTPRAITAGVSKISDNLAGLKEKRAIAGAILKKLAETERKRKGEKKPASQPKADKPAETKTPRKPTDKKEPKKEPGEKQEHGKKARESLDKTKDKLKGILERKKQGARFSAVVGMEAQTRAERIDAEMDKARKAALKSGKGWMKARNWRITNLNEEQWLYAKTDDFKKWFGDWEKTGARFSRIIDKNGDPEVLYVDEAAPIRYGTGDGIKDRDGTVMSLSSSPAGVIDTVLDMAIDRLRKAGATDALGRLTFEEVTGLAREEWLEDNYDRDDLSDWSDEAIMDETRKRAVEIAAELLEDEAKRPENAEYKSVIRDTASMVRSAAERIGEWDKDQRQVFARAFKIAPADSAYGADVQAAIEGGYDGIAINRNGRRQYLIADTNGVRAATKGKSILQGNKDVRWSSFIGLEGARRLGFHGNVKDAIAMEASGESKTAIWQKTGWWRGKDGKWRFELSDPKWGSEFVRKVDEFLAANKNSSHTDGMTVFNGSFLDVFGSDSQILTAYPALAEQRLVLRVGGGMGSRAGNSYATAGNGVIEMPFPDVKSYVERGGTGKGWRDGALWHELQHLIQNMEGMAQGSSVSALNDDPEAFRAYMTTYGEYEARLAEARSKMTAEERKTTPPWENKSEEFSWDELTVSGTIREDAIDLNDGKLDLSAEEKQDVMDSLVETIGALADEGTTTFKDFAQVIHDDFGEELWTAAKPMLYPAWFEALMGGAEIEELEQREGNNIIAEIDKTLANESGEKKEGVEVDTIDDANDVGDGTFVRYAPKHKFAGSGGEHPSALVQSGALAAMGMPELTYKLNLPKSVLKNLSDAQLEAISYALQATEEKSPNGNRYGFMIGDGTGVGKGREIAGIIADRWHAGDKKAVWISQSWDLGKDAIRDLNDVAPELAKNLVTEFKRRKRAKPGEDPHIYKGTAKLNFTDKAGKKKDGLAFFSYDWLRPRRGQNSNEGHFKELVDWLGGESFNGVIALDEAHTAKNIEERGSRGAQVVELQKMLPNARFVYVSATAATEAEDFGYATRLGLFGDGADFVDYKQFAEAVKGGGTTAMELVSRSIAGKGRYLARQLSFEGVTNVRKVHEMTDTDKACYDDVSNLMGQIFAAITKASQVMRLIPGKIGENYSSYGLSIGNPQDREKIKNMRKYANLAISSIFPGFQQRVFNSLLTSLEMPTALKEAQERIKNGEAVVFQLTNTNEAQQSRGIERATDEESGEVNLEDVDVSPFQIIRDYLTNENDEGQPTFPWKKPVIDEEGSIVDWVADPMATSIRNTLLHNLDELQEKYKLANPIDAIIEAFGADNVAELTGRDERKVGDKLQKRGETDKFGTFQQESQAFLDDKKKVLVFSKKGSTGLSFHASPKFKNGGRKRAHFLIQAGWRADEALQGMGRTHRSDEQSQPEYVLMSTDLSGHMRFISSVARRLAQLGSLTSGDRSASGGGMFTEDDNLEDSYAQMSVLPALSEMAKTGGGSGAVTRMLGWSYLMADSRVGVLQEVDKLQDKRYNVTPQRFLNRILMLPVALQNEAFNYFSNNRDMMVERAKANKTYDEGMQTLHAESIDFVDKVELEQVAGSSLKTEMVTVDAAYKSKKKSADEMKTIIGDGKGWRLMKNKKNGQVVALQDGGPKTVRGTTFQSVYEYRPNGEIHTRNTNMFSSDKYDMADSKGFFEAWAAETNKMPSVTHQTLRLITGDLLRAWVKRVNKEAKPHIYRVKAEGLKGSFIGMLVGESEMVETLSVYGKEEIAIKQVLDNLFRDLTKTNKKYICFGTSEYGTGRWELSRHTFADGKTMIEVSGSDMKPSNIQEIINSYKGELRKVNGKERIFIPADEENLRDFVATHYIIVPQDDENENSRPILTTQMGEDSVARRQKKQRLELEAADQSGDPLAWAIVKLRQAGRSYSYNTLEEVEANIREKTAQMSLEELGELAESLEERGLEYRHRSEIENILGSIADTIREAEEQARRKESAKMGREGLFAKWAKELGQPQMQIEYDADNQRILFKNTDKDKKDELKLAFGGQRQMTKFGMQVKGSDLQWDSLGKFWKISTYELPDAMREDLKAVINAEEEANENEDGARFSTPRLYTGSAADYAHRREDGSIENGPSLHYVGTGEGNQVYGWGLYASTKKSVAMDYATADANRKRGRRQYLVADVSFDGKPARDNEKLFNEHLGLISNLENWGSVDTVLRNYEFYDSRGKLREYEKEDYEFLKKNLSRFELKENKPNPEYLYEQTFFTDRKPGDESHLLKWYEPVTKEQKQWIADEINKSIDDPEMKYVVTENGFRLNNPYSMEYKVKTGKDAYQFATIKAAGIADSKNASEYPRLASELLARAGIDGVKYPVDSYGKPIKDGDKAGWNYVSFRDDNIRVDHKWVDGEMRFSSPEAGLGDETSIAKARIDEWRKARNMRELADAETRKDEKVAEEARAQYANVDEVNRLIAVLDKSPRALTDTETLTINFRLNDLETKYGELQDAASDAVGAGNRAQAEDLQERAQFVLDEIDKCHKALRTTGRMQALAFRMRRMLTGPGLTLAGLMAERKARLGRDLTAEETAQVMELARALKEANGKIDAEVVAAAVARYESEAKKILGMMPRPGSVKEVRELTKIDKAYEDALMIVEDHAQMAGGTLLGLRNGKKLISDIMRYHRTHGIEDFDAAMAAVHRDLISRGITCSLSEILQMVSGYGVSWRPDQSEVERDLRDWKQQALKLRQLEEIQLKLQAPLATGLQRDKPSDEVRRLEKEKRRLMKELGIEEANSENRLRGVLDSIKTRLKNEIADLDRAIANHEKLPPKSGNRVQYDEEANRLKAERDEKRAMYEQIFPAEPLSLDERIKRARKVLDETLARVEQELEDAKRGVFRGREQKERLSTPELDRKRLDINRKRDEIREWKKRYFPDGTPEEQAAWIKRRIKTLNNNIAKWQQKEMTRDFKPQEKRKPITNAKIAQLEKERKAIYEKILAMRRADERSRQPFGKVRDWLDVINATPRVLKTMLDLSATLMQGAWEVMAHPRLGVDALVKSVKSFYSADNATAIAAALKEDAAYEDFKQAGGHIYSQEDYDMQGVPEEFRASKTPIKIFGREFSLEKIPGVAASERSFSTFLNQMNLSVYKALCQHPAWGETGPSLEQKKDIAAAVNMMSGYGYSDKGGRGGKLASVLLWAPRLAVSRLGLTTGYDIWGTYLRGLKDQKSMAERNKAARVLAANHARAMAGQLAATLLLTILMGRKDDDWLEEVLDPASSNFGNVRVGDTNINMTGGVTQWVTLMTRLITGKTIRNGVSKDANRIDTAERFLRGKASPLVGVAWSIMEGKDFSGEPYTAGKAVKDVLLPLAGEDIYEAFRINGPANGMLVAPFIALGAGKSTYQLDEYARATAKFGARLEAFEEAQFGQKIPGTRKRDWKTRDLAKAKELKERYPILAKRGTISAYIQRANKTQREVDKMVKMGMEPSKAMMDRLEKQKADVMRQLNVG